MILRVVPRGCVTLCVCRYIVHQFAKVLPNNAEARRAFVSSGGLKKVQEIQAEPGSKLKECVQLTPRIITGFAH